MPIKTYPSEVETEFATASLRRFSSAGCIATGGSSIVDSSSQLKKFKTRTATGWTTPGWAKMRNSGKILPFTKWTRFEVEGQADLAQREWCSSGSGNRHRWENFYRGGTDVNIDATYVLDKINLPDLEYYVQQAAAAIYGNSFDALTFLAEIGQLRRMLFGVGRKFVNLTEGKSPGRIWDLWLEGRYGWRTLRYDIIDFSESLKNANDRRKRYKQSKGGNTDGEWNSYSESTSAGLTTGITRTLSWSANFRGSVVADIDVPGMRFNPLTTAWEVTRLSFVVDWLLNIGQALEAATFLLLTKQYAAGAGYEVKFDLDVEFSHVTQSAGYVVHGNGGHASSTGRIVSRGPRTVGVTPHVKLRLDAYKVTDLFALVLQRIAR